MLLTLYGTVCMFYPVRRPGFETKLRETNGIRGLEATLIRDYHT